MNYPNDILNFGLAVEEAKSQNIDVSMRNYQLVFN